MTNLKSVLSKLWYGKYSLPRAFWGFFIFGQFAAFFTAMILYVPVVVVVGSFPPVMGALAVLVIAYTVTAMVGVWRSSNARRQEDLESGIKYPLLPMLAKIVVLIFAASYLVTAGTRFEILMRMLVA